MSRPYQTQHHAKHVARLALIFLGPLLSFFLPLLASAQEPPLQPAQQQTSPNSTMKDDKDIPVLEQGKPIERELTAGEVHSYRIMLIAGQYMHVQVDQRGIDVVVTVFGPDGKKLAEVDSPNGTQGPEPVLLVAEASGSYRLEVRLLEKNATAGRYEAKLVELRAATPRDRSRIAAQRVFSEAEQLRDQKTTESRQKAIERILIGNWR